MQGLNPLAVQDIALVAGREPPGQVAVDEAAMEAVRFQNLEEGDPVHAGGFHGDGLDAVFDQPVGDGVQVGCVRAERAHDLGLVGARDAEVDLLGADVGAGCVRIDDRQTFSGADFAFGERVSGGFGARHRETSWVKNASGPATRVR